VKKKLILVLLAGTLCSATAMAQTARDRVEKAMKDPKAAENEAKADSLLMEKKIISDTTTYKPAKARKERSCIFKRKKKQKTGSDQ
jgi:hypothetical protein